MGVDFLEIFSVCDRIRLYVLFTIEMLIKSDIPPCAFHFLKAESQTFGRELPGNHKIFISSINSLSNETADFLFVHLQRMAIKFYAALLTSY